MVSLSEAIVGLEAALAKANHPLGLYPSSRPARRSREQLISEAANHGLELSGELLELWTWWSGRDLFKSLWHLTPFERLLPGDLVIHDIDYAYQLAQMQRNTDLYPAVADLWLPIGMIGERVFVWCDLTDPTTAQSPVIVNDREHPPDEDSLCRFTSIAELLEMSSYIVENGWWEDHPDFGWHYSGPQGEAWY